MLEGDFDRDVMFTPALRLKDVDYALQLAESLELGAPFGDAARDSVRALDRARRRRGSRGSHHRGRADTDVPANL